LGGGSGYLQITGPYPCEYCSESGTHGERVKDIEFLARHYTKYARQLMSLNKRIQKIRRRWKIYEKTS
jgi:hypothetical protein